MAPQCLRWLCLLACAHAVHGISSSPLRGAAASALWRTRPLLRSNWVFHYAHLGPYDEKDAEGARVLSDPLTQTDERENKDTHTNGRALHCSAGACFLATNVGFAIAGAALFTTGGDPLLGALTECAGAASVGYHYAQLKLGGEPQRPLVQLAMLVDYAFAVPTLVGGLAYAVSLGNALPASALVCSAIAFAGLVAGWFFESPRSYMLLHGVWHVMGAAAGIELSKALATVA